MDHGGVEFIKKKILEDVYLHEIERMKRRLKRAERRMGDMDKKVPNKKVQDSFTTGDWACSIFLFLCFCASLRPWC